jgi:hypothetical protein
MLFKEKGAVISEGENSFESFTIDSVSPTEDNDYIYVIGIP